MAERLQMAGQAVYRVERCRIVYQPVRKVLYSLGVRDIMALNQVMEQYGVKVFLMDLYSQVPVKSDDFREAAGFPVIFKRLLHEKPFLC